MATDYKRGVGLHRLQTGRLLSHWRLKKTWAFRKKIAKIRNLFLLGSVFTGEEWRVHCTVTDKGYIGKWSMLALFQGLSCHWVMFASFPGMVLSLGKDVLGKNQCFQYFSFFPPPSSQAIVLGVVISKSVIPDWKGMMNWGANLRTDCFLLRKGEVGGPLLSEFWKRTWGPLRLRLKSAMCGKSHGA